LIIFGAWEENMTLIDRLQELLEAERAGVKCLDAMADAAKDMGKKELFSLFRNDEGRFCAGLFGFLQARGAAPTTNTGAFADKVIALPTEAERVALLVKGQSWVVRKIDELPSVELNAGEKAFFADMREVHVVNIEKCGKFV
jgi:nitronate monooxygenase